MEKIKKLNKLISDIILFPDTNNINKMENNFIFHSFN